VSFSPTPTSSASRSPSPIAPHSTALTATFWIYCRTVVRLSTSTSSAVCVAETTSTSCVIWPPGPSPLVNDPLVSPTWYLIFATSMKRKRCLPIFAPCFVMGSQVTAEYASMMDRWTSAATMFGKAPNVSTWRGEPMTQFPTT